MSDITKTTRRVMIRTGLGLVAAGSVASMAPGKARADEKLDPKLVQYQTMPKDGAACSKCVNWEAPNACKIVAGTISPEGWCVAFAPKEG